MKIDFHQPCDIDFHQPCDIMVVIFILSSNWRSFIDLLPCNTLSETLMLLGFFLFQVSVRVYGLTQMWHRSILGRMPFLAPL